MRLAVLQDPASWEQVRAGLFSMWTDGMEVPDLHRYVGAMGRYGAGHWHRAGSRDCCVVQCRGIPLAALARLPEPCPTHDLYAQPADGTVLLAQREYAEAHPWFSVERVPVYSHFPMFEVPDRWLPQSSVSLGLLDETVTHDTAAGGDGTACCRVATHSERKLGFSPVRSAVLP